MRQGRISNEQHRAMTERTRSHLREAARQRRTLGYGELIAELDLPMKPRSPELHDLLYAVSVSEHELGHPLLSALVVRQKEGDPGYGFYRMARERGFTVEEGMERAFWEAERDRVFAFWSER